jgi:DNA-binding LytR/AlgR family response regulator
MKPLNPPAPNEFDLKWEQEGENLLINIRLSSNNALVPLLKERLPQPRTLLETPPVVDGIFVRNGSRFDKIRFGDILYMEAQGAYTLIHSRSKCYTLSRNLTRVCLELPYPFMRVHRSYTINIENIDSFSETIVYYKEKQIPVSEQYRKELLKHFNCL